MTPDALRAAIEADRVRWLDHTPSCIHDTTGRGQCADCDPHMSAAAAVAALWSQGAPTQPDALDLDAIEARATAASAGPWEHGEGYEQGDPGDYVSSATGGIVVCSDTPPTPSDAAFIAAARTDVPALVARVRELEEEVAAYSVRGDFIRAEIRAVAKSVDVPGGDEVATAKRMANCITRLRAQLAAQAPAVAHNPDRAQIAALAGARFAEQHPEAAAGVIGNTSVSRRAAST